MIRRTGRDRWRILLTTAVAAGVALPWLTACSTDHASPVQQPAATSPTDTTAPRLPAGTANPQAGIGQAPQAREEEVAKYRRKEDLIAECMEQRGYTYVPYVPDEILHPPMDPPTDLAGLKAYRAKYGWGDIFAPFAYPDDPNLRHEYDEKDPNAAIWKRMDRDQANAYWSARHGADLRGAGGCTNEASSAVGDPVPTPGPTSLQAHRDAVARWDNDKVKAFEALNDLQIVLLRQDYLACMNGRGHAANSDDYYPTKLLLEKYGELRGGAAFRPIDPETARQWLDQEIPLAVDDAECGKDYYPARMEKMKQIGVEDYMAHSIDHMSWPAAK